MDSELPFQMSDMEEHNAKRAELQQLQRRRQLKRLLLLGIAMLGLVFMVVFVLKFSFSKPAPPPFAPLGPEERRSQEDYSEWHDISCKQQCKRDDFSKPPLVILSFDGFARDYLDRGIVKSLEKLASCGATAERVFPSYPSKTFPNHYTMVTGLYPESHGVVDNHVFDPAVSPKLEYMASTWHKDLWMGDPIWSIYKRQTGGKTGCLYYAGCAFNTSGYPPDLVPRYNKDFPTRNRFDRVRKWLNLPSDERPGLITAYFDQPDTTGHYKISDDDVNQKLVELDRSLDQFLTNLSHDGILDCINLVIVSDHGMQTINKTVLLRKEMNMTGLIGTPGVISRIYINGTRDIKEVTAPFECKKGEEMRVFTRKTMPIRKHYSRTGRIGDVIIQGESGTTFLPTETDDWDLTSDHGYDYQLSSMHTIFFASGPSIKKGVMLPPFQNVEYLNLFMDLLELDPNIPNNGTHGALDGVLVSPREQLSSKTKPIQECPLNSGAQDIKVCNRCPEEEQKRLNDRLRECSSNPDAINRQILQFNTIVPMCYQNYCNKTVLTSPGSEKTKVLIEHISIHDEQDTRICQVVNTKYAGGTCSAVNGTHSGRRYLSVNMNSEFSKISSTEFNFGEGFVKKYYDVLNDLTLEYLARYQRLTVISGVAHDSDLDGIMDKDVSGPPTHFYRILIKCADAWTSEGRCENYNNFNSLAFIFPIVQEEINCLPKDKLLLEYTARIRDVELLSGLELIPRNTPLSAAIQFRTRINVELW